MVRRCLYVTVIAITMLLAACPFQPPKGASEAIIKDYNEMVFGLWPLIAATIAGALVQIIVAVINGRKIDRNIQKQDKAIEKSDQAIKAGNSNAEKFVEVSQHLHAQERKLEKVAEKVAAAPPIVQVVVPPPGTPTPQPGDRRAAVTAPIRTDNVSIEAEGSVHVNGNNKK